MKKTRFMRKSHDSSGNLLLLNTYTGDLSKISKDKSQDVEYVLSNPDTEEFLRIKRILINKGYLVEDDVNESARAELKYFEVAHSTKNLVLTILPTEDCNFRCEYCYEEHNIGRMAPNIIDAIKKFVERNLYKYDMLQVNWFGGEPLEAVDIIVDLSAFFMDICAKQKKPYLAGITTNGYCLKPESFKKLYSLHITDYQITIDGTEKTHNLARPHKDGANSYQVIKNNLINIRDNVKTKNVSITIRTNITKSVMDIIDSHIDFLDKEFGDDPRFGVIFKVAWSNNKDTDYNRSELLPSDALISVLNKCFGKKINFFDYCAQLWPESGICYAACSNAYVFGADGKLYKCTAEFKNSINNIGYINDNGELIIDKDKWAFWVMKTPFKGEYEKCTSCFFQPACMGNYCPLKRVDERGNHVCCDMKDNVDLYMKLCAESPRTIEEVKIDG